MRKKLDIYQNWLEARAQLVERDDILEPIRKFTKLVAEDDVSLSVYSYNFHSEKQKQRINDLETECDVQYLGVGHNRVTFGVGRSEDVPTLKIGGEEICLALKCFYADGDYYYKLSKGRWPMYDSHKDIAKGSMEPKIATLSLGEILSFEKFASKNIYGGQNVPRLHGIICSNGIILHLQEDLTKGKKINLERVSSKDCYIQEENYIFDFKREISMFADVDAMLKYWDSKLIIY